MASTTTASYGTSLTARVNRTRALGVTGAVIAAAAVWVVEAPILGLHLIVRFGTGSPETIGIGLVVGASLIASLLGWALFAILERRTPRARTIWTVVAVAVLVVSLSLPLAAAIAVSTKVALGLMHLAVAAVLIPTLRGASPARRV